ncbi:8694_t:CDS:2, partial [Gigaspora margarita]
TWSPNQRSKKDTMVGPRFEQTDLEVQPNTAAAIELIAEEPIHYVEGRIAVCHGGIYIYNIQYAIALFYNQM